MILSIGPLSSYLLMTSIVKWFVSPVACYEFMNINAYSAFNKFWSLVLERPSPAALTYGG